MAALDGGRIDALEDGLRGALEDGRIEDAVEGGRIPTLDGGRIPALVEGPGRGAARGGGCAVDALSGGSGLYHPSLSGTRDAVEGALV